MVIKQKNSVWEGNQSLHLFIYLAVADLGCGMQELSLLLMNS